MLLKTTAKTHDVQDVARFAPGRPWCVFALAANLLVAACVNLERPSIVDNPPDAGGFPDMGLVLDLGDGDDVAAPVDVAPDLAIDRAPDLPTDRLADLMVTPNNGLVAYWPLDEGIGIHLEDKTANKNDGHALNGASWVNTGLPAPLRGDRAALRFDGVNDYAILGVVGVPANDGPRTVSLWVNIASASPSQHFITLTNGYSASLELGLRAGVLAVMGWNALMVVNTAAPTRNAWHHIVHTYQDGENKLYVDGTMAAMATAVKGAAPTSEAWLGSGRGRGNYFGGQLDDIRIYDRALSAAEIAAMFAGAAAVIDPPVVQPAPPIPDLIGHWKLDESTAGTVLADSSGQNSTGIPVNRPAPSDPVRTVVFPNPHSLSFYNNQCARLNNPAVLNFEGAITFSAWIYPTMNSGLRQIIGHGPGDRELGLRLDNGSYQVYSMDGQPHLAGFAIPTDDIAIWIHLAGVYDGAAWRLYRNGRQIAVSVDRIGALAVNTGWGLAGSPACDGRFFQGNLDDVRIYKRGLTAEEIRRIARGEL